MPSTAAAIEMRALSLVFLISMLLVSGCRIRVVVPAGGQVETESGSFTCAAGEECEIEVVDLFFEESFVARTDNNHRFLGWKSGERALCKKSRKPCSLSTAAFGEHDFLMRILASDDEFTLSPDFQKQTATAGSVLLCTGMSNARDICGYGGVRHELQRSNGYTVVNGGFAGRNYYTWINSKVSKRWPDGSLISSDGTVSVRNVVFWDKARQRLADAGLSFEDVSHVLNLNTLALGDPERDYPGDQQAHLDLVEGQRLFQEDAEKLLPNLVRGWHMVRSEDTWCAKSPPPMVSLHPGAIQEGIALAESRGSTVWRFGPDLSMPEYFEHDFRDGCHFISDKNHPGPGSTGKQKVASVIETFFRKL